MLGKRPAESHKGDFGHLLVIAGSPRMSGAAALAAGAALRAGAGLVTLATGASVCRSLAGAEPEVMFLPLPEEGAALGADALGEIASFLPACDAILAGPGLGPGETVGRLAGELPALAAGKPLLLDAEILNRLAGNPAPLLSALGPLVVTPHPGEMARLAGIEKSAVQADRARVAAAFSRKHRVITVLKGHRTIIAAPGGNHRVNLTGNPGLATAGSGDVLAGVIGAFLARGSDAFEAARLGVYLHGLAGDFAARETGEVSLIARDIIAKLAAAIRFYQELPG